MSRYGASSRKSDYYGWNVSSRKRTVRAISGFLRSLRPVHVMLVATMLPVTQSHARATQQEQLAQARAAQLCAEGQRLYQNGDYASAEQRFLAGITESEKNTQATELRGACLMRLSSLQSARKA